MADKTHEDPMGLGMDAFIEEGSSPEKEESKEDKTQEEAKPDEKSEEKVEEKKEEPAPKEEEKEAKLEKDTPSKEKPLKVDATEEPEKKEEKEEDQLKASSKLSEAEKQKTSPIKQDKLDWESADNPYRKRYADTAKWANQKNQENLDNQRKYDVLLKQVDNIHKKIDGTFDENVDNVPAPSLSLEEERLDSESVGRAKSSRLAADQQFGKEVVDKYLEDFELLYGQDKIMQHDVLHSDMPVLSAIQTVQGYHFSQKYGTDPDKVVDNIRQEVKKELEPQIRKEESERIMGRIDNAEGNSEGLSKVKGSAASGETAQPGDTSLNELFPGPGL